MNTENFRTTALQAWNVETPWTLLLQNAGKEPDTLEKLLGIYADPIYGFYRREGLNSADAEDLTQQLLLSFFLVRESHFDTSPAQGRFRQYLLAAAKNMLLDWRKGLRAQKRGGAQGVRSIEELQWNDTAWQPAGGASPEEEFERQWARTTWQAALELFRQREEPELTQTLEVYYHGEQKLTQEEAARKLNVSLDCFNSRMHRARKRLQKTVRDVIRSTVASENDVEEEMQRLHELLGQD
jgi:RNA polymerase sigma factor (sigma-70 family)